MSSSKKSAADASNPKLAKAAEDAVSDARFVRQRGMCQRFVREVIQSKYGSQFDRYHGPTAAASERAWKGSPYAVDPARGSVVGDILYYHGKGHSDDGHVVIRVPGNRVAENSTAHNTRNGGKGFRSLTSAGKPTLIVRLPRL